MRLIDFILNSFFRVPMPNEERAHAIADEEWDRFYKILSRNQYYKTHLHYVEKPQVVVVKNKLDSNTGGDYNPIENKVRINHMHIAKIRGILRHEYVHTVEMNHAKGFITLAELVGAPLYLNQWKETV